MTSPGLASIEPILYLMVVAMGVAAGVLALVAAWAALGRGHWFVRGAAVCGSLGLLYPVAAYEPLVIFAMADVAIIAVLLAIRRSVARRAAKTAAASSDAPPRPRFQFRLIDGLLAIGLVAVYCALIPTAWQRSDNFDGGQLVVGAICVVLLTVPCVLLGAATGWKRRALAVLVVALGTLVTAANAYFELEYAGFYQLSLADWQDQYHGVSVWATFWGAFCGMVLIASWLLHASGWLCFAVAPGGRRGMLWVARGAFGALAILLAVPLASLYARMVQEPPLPPPPSTGPNALPYILELAQRMSEINPYELTAAELRAIGQPAAADEFSELCDAVLNRAASPGYIAIESAQLPLGYMFMLEEVSSFRMLVHSLSAQAEGANRGGRIDDSIAYNLACLRVGVMVSRGGTVTDVLIGMAGEGAAIENLARMRQKVSPAQSRELLIALVEADTLHEPFETIQAREKACTVGTYDTWTVRFDYAFFDVLRQHPTGQEPLLGAVNRREARLRLLMVDLAIRVFQSEKGRLPADLNELVPEYLAKLPVDPYAGTPFRYKRQGDTFLLYSVGEDGRDDGGSFGKWDDQFSGVPFDLDLDVLSR